MGSSWASTNVSIANVDINAMATFNHQEGEEDIIAATNNGIYVSADNGAEWTPKNNGLRNMIVLSLAVIHGMNGNDLLFAGTWGGGIFQSTDGGQNWLITTSGLTNGWVFCLAVGRTAAGTDKTTLYAGTKEGLFFSKDYGTTWLSTSLNKSNIRAICVSEEAIFVGTQGGLYLSKDNGSTWVKTSLTNKSVRTIMKVGRQIFAGTSDGVFFSSNGGSTWTNVNNGLATANITALSVFKGWLTAGTWGGGIWRRPLYDFRSTTQEH